MSKSRTGAKRKGEVESARPPDVRGKRVDAGGRDRKRPGQKQEIRAQRTDRGVKQMKKGKGHVGHNERRLILHRDQMGTA